MAIFRILILIVCLTSCGKDSLVEETEAVILQRSPSETNPGRPSSYYFKKYSVYLKMNWKTVRNTQEESLVDISFVDEFDRPMKMDYQVSSYIWMPSMGYGSTPITITRKNEFTFSLSEIFFINKGFWEIHFVINDGIHGDDEVVDGYIIAD